MGRAGFFMEMKHGGLVRPTNESQIYLSNLYPVAVLQFLAKKLKLELVGR